MTDPHASMQRLLAAACAATSANTRDAVHGYGDLVRSMSESAAVITNWKRRGVSKAGAIKAGRLYDCDPAWILFGATAGSAPTSTPVEPNMLNERPALYGRTPADPRGVAHSLSDHTPRIPPTSIGWEALSVSKLPKHFELQVRDEAMSPLLRLGNFAEFTTARAPRPGDVVLLTDRDGEAFIREYRVSRGTHWQASAMNHGFQTLDSVHDGLTAHAVLIGVRWESP